uniref:Uncharacterized protein n=1 Tax=Ciona savignyi TaxID=51511 RepID=H2ZQ55_CIOSA
MVEEIQVLMQQLQLGKKATKDMHISHVEEVSRLTNRLAVSQAEFQVEEKDGIKLKEELKSLKQQVDELKVECSEKITPHEHAHKVKRLQTDLELMQETSDKEIKSLTQKLKALQKEKSKFSMEVTELTAENEQLKGEIESMMQNRRKCQQEMDLLRSSLEESEQRELDCQLHLSNVVRLAERATTDRATFAAIAEREQKSAHTVLRDSMREKWEMGRMEESLRQCKVKLASQTDDVNNRLREVEETHIGHLNECERKMRHLQKLLQQKQQALDDMARNKQEIERDLENVWQAANSENRRLMEALCKS